MCGGEGRGGSAPAIVLFMLPSLRALSFMLRALFMLQPTPRSAPSWRARCRWCCFGFFGVERAS